MMMEASYKIFAWFWLFIIIFIWPRKLIKWFSFQWIALLIYSFQSSSVSDRQSLQKSYKDGYESDSTLSYRRHQFIPQQSENKSLYTQVQKGGDVPPQGLRMQAPDKKGKTKFCIQNCMFPDPNHSPSSFSIYIISLSHSHIYQYNWTVTKISAPPRDEAHETILSTLSLLGKEHPWWIEGILTSQNY